MKMCVIVFCAVLMLSAAVCNAQPQRLTTEKERQEMAQKKQVVQEEMPDWKTVSDKIDEAFPDAKQREVMKRVVKVLLNK